MGGTFLNVRLWSTCGVFTVYHNRWCDATVRGVCIAILKLKKKIKTLVLARPAPAMQEQRTR